MSAGWSRSIAFQNSYAIAVRRDAASKYHLRTISDLARESPHLVAGFTADFIGRPDGLAGLARAYGVHPRAVRPLAPAVKYQALASGAVDVIDGYSTDGLLSKYDLVTLIDDKHFFPPYEAAAVIGARLARERPDAGRGPHDAQRDARRVADARAQSPHRSGGPGREARGIGRAARSRARARSRCYHGVKAISLVLRDLRFPDLWERRAPIWALVLQHLLLVVLALGAAIIVALPLCSGAPASA